MTQPSYLQGRVLGRLVLEEREEVAVERQDGRGEGRQGQVLRQGRQDGMRLVRWAGQGRGRVRG